MDGVAFFIIVIIAAFLFAVIGVAVLLKKTGRIERNIAGLENRIRAQEQFILNLGAGTISGAAESPEPAKEAAAAPEPASAPAPGHAAAENPVPDHVPVPAQKPAPYRSILNSAAAFVRGGNLWAAGGVVLLIAGFAMLITYLARRGFFTVETGIAAAAFSGLVMLAAGRRFRKKRPVFFLILQGGGIGMLYLSVYAAHKLTPYFPAPVSLVLMSLFVPPAVILALFQSSGAGGTRGSQTLAFLGFLGGFAAPLLLASGGGNHVFLFSYYLVLDAGVLVIAFFRRWKALSILAFCFTFGASFYWMTRNFIPAFFPSSEPFFIAYILLFTVLGVSGSGKTRLPGAYSGGFITLLTPFLGAVLQWMAFSHIEHGYAVVSLSFSVFYISFAVIIRKLGSVRLFSEAYLFLAALLANLALPLELSPRLTSALWAVEGAAFFFLALRLKKFRPALGALARQAAAARAFVFEKTDGGNSSGASPRFTGALVISLSAFVIMLLAERFTKKEKGVKNTLEKLYPAFPFVMCAWACLWWFGGWLYEINRASSFPAEFFFILCSASALLSCAAALVSGSNALFMGLVPSLVFALGLVLGTMGGFIGVSRFPDGVFTALTMRFSVNYFRGFYAWSWIAFFASQGPALFFSRKKMEEAVHGIWLASCVLVTAAVLSASGRALTVFLGLSVSWTSFAGLLPLFAAVIILSLCLRRAFTAGIRARIVFLILPLVLCCILSLRFIVSVFLPGDPAPLPLYIPVLNPLDLEELFCIAVFLLWQMLLLKKSAKEGAAETGALRGVGKAPLVSIVDVSFFIFAMAAAARGVHFYGKIPWRSLPESGVFHLAVFILWAVYGIAHIIAGNKISRRRIWIAGASLTAADIAKLILLDLAGQGAVKRIVSFFIAGLALLLIGWIAPLPPAAQKADTGKQ
ncbi:MAG: DUF2339 domain-containing protein [Treponema sp.]|jgi:uncharacterized membrane protein|nr:DUF2339 domain-containing protein [Treponema sp.]